MRLGALALQLKLENTFVPVPPSITEFPFTFSLANYVAWYWRVRSWKLVFTYDCDFVVAGVSYNISGTITEIATNTRYGDERNGVQDSFQRAVPTDTGIPWILNWSSGQMAAFEVEDFVPGSSRGYWTGSQGGVPGGVIPRWRFIASVTIDAADVTPPFTTSVSLHVNSYRSDFSGGAGVLNTFGTETNGLTFFGLQTDLAWEIDTPTTVCTFNTLTAVITPYEYFEFSNGITPVWDSVTGAQLVDPLSVGY